MSKTHKAMSALTAADIMTRHPVVVQDSIPAIEAAELLMSKSVTGVPVVDDQDRCVGVFSTVDFTRIAHVLSGAKPLPENCPFQVRHRRLDGSDATLCVLPSAICPLQRPEMEEGISKNTCRFPHEIVVEWQALQPQLSPTDPVRRWMSAEPITVESSASLPKCAARMAQAHIHRLIITDNELHVLGILTSMDLLKVFGRNQT